MSTPKTSAKSASLTGDLPKNESVHVTQQKHFAAAVDSIAKRYGVKVTSASTPVKNPYAMSAEQAVKVALRAGIITQAGNLTRTFK